METVPDQDPAVGVPPGRRAREERFAEVAHAVADPLRRYVVRRAPAHEVDDVLADAFLVLWRRLDDVPTDDPLPWAYAVARRCLANLERSRRRRTGLVERIVRLDPPEVLTPAAEPDDEQRADVRAALATLGELDREVVMLWAWEGLAPREIALATDLSANAVSIRLHRARKKLADRLRKDPASAGQEPGEGRKP